MKVIVLGGGVNALGIVRSLGEAWHRATVLAIGA
jgi:predicted ATP-grasp superfamily ATP-dependent carboligase